ncbi:MAG: hypothetical protein BWY63_03522 [Chloroflexi bacterium ADurb.Bin360]|nr:MAG: hypothetical protein BWY63_03522 [Chloroflexi bacterium ADurb.Bin360]
MSTLDLHEGAFGLAGSVVYEGDDAIHAAICAAFALFAAGICTQWARADEGKRPELELETILLCQLPRRAHGLGLPDYGIVCAGD